MFSRSFRLAKASLLVVKAERELLALPLISFVAVLLSVAAVAVPSYFFVFVSGGSEVLAYVAGAVVTYVSVSVALYFQTAMVVAARDHMDGRNPTLGSSLRTAAQFASQILGWALVVTFVKLVLRWVRERGVIGELVAGLADAIFTFATFITVPVLVSERLGPVAALKRSAVLLRKTWGENIVGRFGLGAVTFLMVLAALVIVGGGVAAWVAAGAAVGVPVLLVGVAALVFALVLSTALNAVYQTALYRYATGAPVAGFSQTDLVSAYRRR